MRCRNETVTVARVTIGLAAALVVGCGGESSSVTTNPSTACTAGRYCVNVAVNGAVHGLLSTATPPVGFTAACAANPRQHGALVVHAYGRLDGRTWHLVLVTTTPFTGAGTYKTALTLETVPSSGGNASAYAGDGNATFTAVGTSAMIDGQLKENTNAASSIRLHGSVSCQSAGAA